MTSSAADLRIRAEVIRLMLALGEAVASEAEAIRLNVLLRSDAAARRAYLAHIEMLGNLVWDQRPSLSLPIAGDVALAGLCPTDVDVQELLHWLAQSDCDPMLTKRAAFGDLWSDEANFACLPPAATRSPVAFLHLALASLVTLCIVGVLAMAIAPRHGQVPAPDNSASVLPVATLAGATNARPRGGSPSVAGSSLAPGQRISLTDGAVRVQFSLGATVDLHAPVDFQVLGDRRCRLERGRLAAEVLPGAVGFTVETPTATVVDLGTQFEVEVGQRGASEVRVFRGTVEVSRVAPSGPQERDPMAASHGPVTLRANQGARVAEGRAIEQFSVAGPPMANVIPGASSYVGSPLTKRTEYDRNVGNLYVCLDGATVSGRASQFRFYSIMPDRWVTPLVFKAEDPDVFRLVGVGRSIRSDGSGIQSQAFEPLCGSAELKAGHHYLGMYDGWVQSDDGGILAPLPNAGTVTFVEAGGGDGPWAYYNGEICRTKGLRLGLKFSRAGRADGEPYLLTPGRFYSAQLSIEPAR